MTDPLDPIDAAAPAPISGEDSPRGFWRELGLNIAIPAVYPLGLLVLWLAPKDFGFGRDWVVWTGLAAGTVGLTFWVLGMIHLGNSLAVLPGSKTLVTGGIYRFTAHPIYRGISLTMLGLVLCLGSTWGLAYLVLVVTPLNWVRARMEDTRLAARFGGRYAAWRARTWF